MNDFIGAAILLFFAGLAVIIRKTYFQLPRHEWQRRAKQGDKRARQLYRAVAYGGSLRVLLWVVIGLLAASGFVLLARVTSVGWSLILILILLGLLFVWLPNGRPSRFGMQLTLAVTPAVAWLLNYLHPSFGRAHDLVVQRHQTHTGLFERGDLLGLLERQTTQSDSRITSEEIAIAQRALKFSDHTVADLLIPRKQIKTVAADTVVGPILIDELHKGEATFVLVTGNTKNDIVGSLAVNQLGIKSSGHVRDHMDNEVYFLHERDNLSEALHAFYVTNQPVFVVVNDHDEYLGIITIQTIVEHLLGHMPGEEFEQYADRQAVAARHEPKPEPEPEPQPEVESKPIEESETAESEVESKIEEPDEIPLDDEAAPPEEIAEVEEAVEPKAPTKPKKDMTPLDDEHFDSIELEDD